MSRREEVDQALDAAMRHSYTQEEYTEAIDTIARNLADEIDALREENERLDRKRLENALAARRYLKKAHEERAAYAVLLESHEIILDALTESDDKLAAAIDRDERFDCLAAENADLRRELDELSREIVAAHFANATLEKLREVVPEGRMQCLKCDSTIDPNYLGCGDWRCEDCERELSQFDIIDAFRDILYPKETA
jgi:tRNA(Ile2) C34 agmatinyltransferase TiaS